MRAIFAIVGVVILFLLVGSCTMLTNVEPGHVGIKVNKWGSNTGVEPAALTPGMYWAGPGTYIVEYPVTTKTVAFTGKEEGNEEADTRIRFQDKNGLNLEAPLSISYHVDQGKAPGLYSKYRLQDDQLADGPIKRILQDAINKHASQMGVEEIYGPRKAELLEATLKDLRGVLGPQGVDVEQLMWAGNLGVPQNVRDQINAKIANEQAALAAQANVAKAEAEGRSTVAKAEADAKATRIKAEAIRTNPEILTQMAIEKWQGQVPQYVTSGNAIPFINLNK